MNRQKAEQTMINAGLRPSPVRTLIFGALSEASLPVSSLDIEMRLETVDRSSITRSLALFVEKGLVHVVDDGSGALKYELCRAGGHHGLDDDSHPHFHCIKCGTTECLDGVQIPTVCLPGGYSAISINYVIKGICSRCQASDENTNTVEL
ncbi:MAG: transcriptional repressor [Muribaculum sp.]|nr:transcriptional repressor [Muribaculum sp.]